MLQDKDALSYFESVTPYAEITDADKRIVLCHYPICEWNGFYHDTWHIYGHIHNNTNGAYQYMKNLPRALNAGACLNNYTPVTFDELVRNNKKFNE